MWKKILGIFAGVNSEKPSSLQRIAVWRSILLVGGILLLTAFLIADRVRFRNPLPNFLSRRGTYWPLIQDTEAADMTRDFQLIALNPSITFDFHGAKFTTNIWAMRDKEYERIPGRDSFRVAILGSSIVMGSGVADEEVFESVLEDRLNEEFGGQAYENYELLNFAVAGFSPLQELLIFETKALGFSPDALFYFANTRDESKLIPALANRISIGAQIPYPGLNTLIQGAGINSQMSPETIEARLDPLTDEILSWVYLEIVALSQASGVLPIWIYLPDVKPVPSEQIFLDLSEKAREAGFIIVNLSGIFEGYDRDALIVAAWDLHPNRTGHVLIADGLYKALLTDAELGIAFGLNQ